MKRGDMVHVYHSSTGSIDVYGTLLEVLSYKEAFPDSNFAKGSWSDFPCGRILLGDGRVEVHPMNIVFRVDDV